MDIGTFKSKIEDILVVDVETLEVDHKKVNPFTNKLKGVGFSTGDNVAIYLQYTPENVPLIQELLSKPLPKLGHNLKFDIITLMKHGFKINGDYEDSYILAKCINKFERNSLKDLMNEHLGGDMKFITELINDHRKDKHRRGSIDDIPTEVLGDYCKKDCTCTSKVFKWLYQNANKEAIWLYENIERPLIKPLIEMQMRGIKVSIEGLKVAEKKIVNDCLIIRSLIWEFCGKEFNINSTQQLAVALYDDLGYPILGYTKKGEQPKVDEYTLNMLSKRGYSVVDWILQYKKLIKLNSSFVIKIRRIAEENNNRIHASLNSVGTITGRFSSSSPNLQQMPKAGEDDKYKYGEYIRKAFIPDEGKVLLSADYEQMEIVMAANLTKEPKFVIALKANKDVHQETADDLIVSRGQAKTINFGMLYGITEYGLSRQLKIPLNEAIEKLTKYRELRPGIHEYTLKQVEQIKAKGYVETLLGRRRYMNPNEFTEQALYARSINTPIQGSCADIMKKAMGELYKKFQGTSVEMLLQIHDELLFQVNPEDREMVKKVVRETMENTVKLDIPLKVKITEGANWSEL